jgi:carbohydrate diacid regulator
VELREATATRIATRVETLFDTHVRVQNPKGEALAGTLQSSGGKSVPLFYDEQPLGLLILEKRQVEETELGVIRSLAELIIQESTYLEDVSRASELLDKAIFDLIQSDQIDADEVIAKTRELGADLTMPTIALVVYVDSLEQAVGAERDFAIERVKKSLARCIQSFYTRSTGGAVAYLGGRIFLVLKDLPSSNPEDVEVVLDGVETVHQIICGDLGEKVTIGVGEYHQGLVGIRRSFEEAKSAADLGIQIHGTGRVYRIGDFGVVAGVVGGLKLKRSRDTELIMKLRQDPEISRTLEVFFDSNMSLTATAQTLKIHRNTLVYRLEKITKLLGLDPREFDEAVQIKLALLLQKFEEEL